MSAQGDITILTPGPEHFRRRKVGPHQLARGGRLRVGMKVLVVAPYPPSGDSNSLWAQAWCQELVRRDSNVQIRVAAAEEHGSCLFQGPEVAIVTPNLEVTRPWNRTFSTGRIEKSILSEVRSFRPDLVHFHFNFFTFGGVLKSLRVLARVLRVLHSERVSTLVTLHSVVASPARYFSTRFGLRVPVPRSLDRGLSLLGAGTLKLAMSSANMVVLTSKEAVVWTRDLAGLPSSVLRYIPLGRLEDGPPKSRFVAAGPPGERDPRPRVAFVGRIIPYKGLDDLVRAAEVLKQQGREIKLRILGAAGTLRAKRDSYIGRLTRLIRTITDGSVALDSRFVPTDEYERLTEATDVFVFPFVDDGVLSASASVLDLGASSPARLVLTTVPRLSEYHDVRGTFFCPEHDPSALADAIWNAVTAPPVDADRRERELRAFSPSEIASQYLDAYRTICPVPFGGGPDYVVLPAPKYLTIGKRAAPTPASDRAEPSRFATAPAVPGAPHPYDTNLLGSKEPTSR